MQARRRAQPSGTNSPSSSHPRLKHRARCVIFFRARHAAARVAPMRGTWQARIHEPRGSAPRERDHRGGDHPVPSRTRQLSPPSPRVLQRQAAGGQGVALAEGAFLFAPMTGRQGDIPLRAFSRSGPMAIRAASACGPWLRPGGVAQRRAGGRSPRCRVWHREARRAASAQCIGVGSTGIVAQARCRSQAKCEGFRVYHLCGWGCFRGGRIGLAIAVVSCE